MAVEPVSGPCRPRSGRKPFLRVGSLPIRRDARCGLPAGKDPGSDFLGRPDCTCEGRFRGGAPVSWRVAQRRSRVARRWPQPLGFRLVSTGRNASLPASRLAISPFAEAVSPNGRTSGSSGSRNRGSAWLSGPTIPPNRPPNGLGSIDGRAAEWRNMEAGQRS